MLSSRYEAPQTVDEAVALLAADADARVLAGGTDLLVQVRTGAPAPTAVVDITRIPEMLSLEIDADGLRCGAAVPAAEIYEKAAPLWAWARVILNSQREATSYGTAIRKDATDNVGSIGNRLPILASGAPSYIRHAPHHGRALTVNEDGSRVSVTLRGFEGHFTVNEYLDKVFALVESVLALNWCLADALDRAGIDVPLSPSDAGYLGASTAKQAVFFLTHFRGYSVSRSEVVDRVWYLDVDMPAEEVLTTAIVIGGAADSDVHTVVLRRLEATGEPVRLGASEVRDHLAAVENAHGLEGVVLVAEFIEQLEMRGGSGLMATQLESVVTAVAVSGVEGHLEDAPLLRRVRMLADRAGRGDLVEVAIATIASVRTGEVERAKQQLAPLDLGQKRGHPLLPCLLQLDFEQCEFLGLAFFQCAQHVTREVELGEIHAAEDRAHQARRAQEAVIAARMHRIEAVRHVLRAEQLDHRDLRGL